MLKIQEYILSHPDDWERSLTEDPYNLMIKRDGKLILFKYHQYNSDFSLQIVKEARGLILEDKSFKVVRKAFNKFFNINEPNAAKIDWNSASATSKEDGSLISLYYYNNKWNVATNAYIDAHDAPMNCAGFKNFYELAYAAFKKFNLDFSKLNTNYTYTFELATPFNTIVIRYPDINLFHIMTVDNTTLEEIETDIGIPKPKYYKFDTEEDYLALVNSLENDREGIVVKDKYNNRLKIKTMTYFTLHKLWNNGNISNLNAVKIVQANEQDEILAYFPEFKEYFESIKKQLDDLEKLIEDINEEVSKYPGTDRKEFYEHYKNNPNFDLYSKAFAGYLKEYVKKMEIHQFVKRFKIK